jgi:hypothetical protein
VNNPKVPSRLLDDIETIQDLLVECEGALDKILLRGGLTEETRTELSDLVGRIREHPLVNSARSPA